MASKVPPQPLAHVHVQEGCEIIIMLVFGMKPAAFQAVGLYRKEGGVSQGSLAVRSEQSWRKQAHMQESGRVSSQDGAAGTKASGGQAHLGSEGCRKLVWPSQSEPGTAGAVGVQEALEVKWAPGPVPMAGLLLCPIAWGLPQCPCPPFTLAAGGVVCATEAQ